MLIPSAEVNILNIFRVMIILRLLLLLTNLHLKLVSTQGTGADKLLSTQRVKICFRRSHELFASKFANSFSYVMLLRCSFAPKKSARLKLFTTLFVVSLIG